MISGIYNRQLRDENRKKIREQSREQSTKVKNIVRGKVIGIKNAGWGISYTLKPTNKATGLCDVEGTPIYVGSVLQYKGPHGAREPVFEGDGRFFLGFTNFCSELTDDLIRLGGLKVRKDNTFVSSGSPT